MYYEIFIKQLRASEKQIASVYFSLFACMPEKDLEEILSYLHTLSDGRDEYFKEVGKENWFYIWHKSVRQANFFNNCYQKRTVALVDDMERKEHRFLRHEYYVNKKEKKSLDPKQLFTDEYKRYLSLSERIRREEKEDSISGLLDSILWNTVHLDTDNVLRNAFERTFKLITVD